ncbi:posphoenolpyruvate synthetase regulatory kinase/phosphorylase PpsR [Bordetella avium]|uniref:Putative phosphoenolpyruvate synthase regulatory protein n=1 Tax=Bordetella avium (strain 197N) TaxID=360910 RepID=PSRP_BORA1|nr:pyruvate, water dikinase regulatory protein [Bordetella avium]Q2L142.1 RecName: Full=Putative phosphoenolpyruvate synthase regulatory protein; Short=PEP synthase regulatory protein; Short=PSRP; AltName: Full=Pyruvate, water dikinase regulatory protein [Bordetella avium 197N]AZY49125.1 phosphoenolpyruvate synthase regulatory protein [Bordetella avium]AZY52483.1 phosphoenolpyruvate synthase regulatory protein [Bordetella avium]RIQ12276.1 phosphoenolpyruvate synthase regulatory protein [Bordete
MSASSIARTVYIVSDSTGITAETFSQSVLSQFDQVDFKPIRLPFIDTLQKAEETAERINKNAADTGVPPIVFSTLVNPEILARVRQANGVFLDLFGTFVSHIEQALGLKSSPSIGRSHMQADSEKYRNRIDAINFSLAHDDGQFVNQLDQADVILVGVSRCGKTPTSLYLAMQYAIKAANFPLTPDDFERSSLPKTIAPYRDKLFGLSIQPERLSEVRNERRPNSRYATIEQCRYEVAEAERMMRRAGISWLSTTTKSIEEIATTVLQEVGLGR